MDRFAQPLETVPRTEPAPERAIERIGELVAEYQVRRIVVGLPLQMDGREGRQAERARAFGDAVAKHTGLPVKYQDERLTSVEATRVLSLAGARPGRNSERVDRVAAALLLGTFLQREET